MSERRELVFNLFDEACVGLRPHGLWAHPENQRLQVGSLDYWRRLAQVSDESLFHSLFLADVVGTYDTYGDSPDGAVEHGVEFPVYDPTVLISAMVTMTEKLGFILTSSTTYEPPFSHARRMSTLDAISGGRIAWNVVTSYLPNAARNYGHLEQVPHNKRYDIAEEYLQLCYKLWEGSWDDGAVLAQRDAHRYADPGKVHRIDHRGEFFAVQGPHLVPPTPQRTPVIAQAGSSPRGRAFAAENAEVIFVHAGKESDTAEYVADIYSKAEAAGRSRHEVAPVVGLTVITGATASKAQERYEEYARWQDLRAYEIHLGGATGFDLSSKGNADRITDTRTDHGVGAVKGYTDDGRMSVGQIRDRMNTLGNGTVSLVGTPEHIADELEAYVSRTGVAGFNLYSVVSPGSLEEFAELVVPVLQERGLFRSAAPGKSLRSGLSGTDLLPDSHPAAAYRNAFGTP